MPANTAVETRLRHSCRTSRAAWAETPDGHFNRVLIEALLVGRANGLAEIDLCQLRQDRVRRANVNGAAGGLLSRVGDRVVSEAPASGLVEASLYQARRERRAEAVRKAPGHFNRAVSEVEDTGRVNGPAEISLCRQRLDKAHRASANGAPGDVLNRVVSEVVSVAPANGLAETSSYRAQREHRAEVVREVAGHFNRVVSAVLVEAPGRVVAQAVVQVVREAKIEARGGASSCPAHRDRARRHPASFAGSVRRGGRVFHRGRNHDSGAGWAASRCADY